MAVDPFTFEIIRHRLDSINDEAAITLRQVSGSPVAVEANDLNTAITMADGTVVACGHYVLCQLASMNLVAADIIREYAGSPGFGPGDQFLTNDPYVGTLHQPDVVVVAPVFADGRLVAWCGSSVHQFDVGGPSAGGMTFDAGSIFDEPTPLPPIKIVAGDRVQRDVERDFLRRSRTPHLNELDMRGQIAANRATSAAITALCARYGADVVTAVMAGLVTATERQLRARLRELPDGRWRHVSYLERGAPQPDGSDIYAVRLTATKRGESLELDFSDSSPQAPGAINAAYPALVNFAVAALLIYLCGDLPWVPGALLRVCRIRSKEGTIAHARWPAGVAMSTASSCQAIRVCVNACLGRMLEGSPALSAHAMASCCSSGGGGGVFAGVTAGGEAFAAMTLDELTGGGGATGAHDGISSSGTTTSPGAACADVEVNESYLPLLYLRRAEVTDSGGPGRFRGGLGGLNIIRPHGTAAPVTILSFAQGLQHPAAPGLAGGEPGGQSIYLVTSAAAALALADDSPGPGTRELGTAGPGARGPGAAGPSKRRPGPPADWALPSRDSAMRGGQAHLAVSQGGGGYGDPLTRDPASVAADVAAGAVTALRAGLDYGVVLTDDAGGHPAADLAATQSLRRRLRSERLGGREPARQRTPEDPKTRPFSLAVRIGDEGTLSCARCGAVLAGAGQDPYARLVVRDVPVSSAAPWSAAYPGNDRFVIRRLYCPSCAAQVDVQVARRDDPVLRTAEPL
jgi:N-methylhydantoinase B